MPLTAIKSICFKKLDQVLQRVQSPQKPLRLVVGYSGGLDSAVLVKLLVDYCNQPSQKKRYILEAVHINHQLSANADVWQAQCEEVCEEYELPITSIKVDVNANGKGIESAARDARYNVFQDICADDGVLLLAHHLNDQAETFFIRLMRGSGALGLGSMKDLSQYGEMPVLRPLLTVSRGDLELLAQSEALFWVDDESNADSRYDRNYLRNDVLPLLEGRWPSMLTSVSRSARLCYESQCLADDLAELDAARLRREVGGFGGCLDVSLLAELSSMRICNVLRYCMREQGQSLPSEVVLTRVLNEVIPAPDDATPLVQWPGGEVRRYDGALYLLSPLIGGREDNCQKQPVSLVNLEPVEVSDSDIQGYALPWGGELFVSSKEGALEKLRSREGAALGGVLHLSLTADQWSKVTVRIGTSKDSLKPANRSANQLKYWWQQHRIPPWFRRKQPLLYCDDALLLAPGLIACESDAGVESYVEKRWVAWWPYTVV
ncbi:tRNA lysidine(34) synthetase TilS [Gammaproteobacteria bacterium 42_54_T18]|nr:tRNA lysidine(34) synthetase TilS [Gammaproteobacteria bacterium 42_54_T18]